MPVRLDAHLFHRAEDVCVILLEASHASETREGTACLISMQNSEVGHSNWQLTVRALSRAEDQAVAWAVHRLNAGIYVRQTFSRRYRTL